MQARPLQLVVLVSGYGSNLQALIRAQTAGLMKSSIKLVISNNPEAFALFRAQKAKIPATVLASKGRTRSEFDKELLETVKANAPDLIVLAGFMKILNKEFIQTFKNRIINIHPSLLPSFPGLNAQKQALDHGVKVSGCTVHFVDEGCDTGPIIIQKSVPIDPGDNVDTLSKKILVLEHQSIVEAVRLIEEGKIDLQENKTLLLENT